MPCYDISAETLAEERRLREEREEQIRQVEEQLEAGIATIVENEDGSFQLMNATNVDGMFDSCVLAELQKRNSQGFQAALAQSQVEANFIAIHNRSHK